MQTQVSTQPRTRHRTNRKAIPVYDAHITSTPGTRGGKPRIVGRRITVSDVAIWFLQMGLSVDEIVRDYDLSHAQVHAALAYYYDHRAEIDAREAADVVEAEALRQRYPSKLQAKLADQGSRSIRQVIEQLELIHAVMSIEEMRGHIEYL